MFSSMGRWFNLKVVRFFYAAGFFLHVLYETLLFPRRKQVGVKVLVLQILFTGVEALGVVSFISLAIGAVIIIQGMNIFPQFGQSQLVYTILITVIVRELGPILTAFIITARSGTAIATELGGMVVSHQIEAYVSIGINPISYLVVPRVLGVTISLVTLTLYFSVAGIVGAYFVSQLFTPIGLLDYFQNLLKVLRPIDIFASLLKSLVFGTIISIVSTYQGFNVKVASTEVPQVVIKAVTQGFALCIFADIIIVLMLRSL
ncbi:MAG TPA: ABC transporter permease [Spirochaetia bacterium]|nr:ABC transporter permease [Spirochaetia bacterium]